MCDVVAWGEAMSSHYVLIKDSGVFVKEGEFFEEQGGLKEQWGKAWEPIDADSLYDARRKAIKLRRERFPNSHVTLGENEPIESAWPEARGQ